MTVQQLHDALGFLPDDLIEETDRRRSRPRSVIPLRRYAAMAAGFALVIASSLLLTRLLQPKGATETAVYEAAEVPAAMFMGEAGQEAAADCVPAEAAEEAPAENSTAGNTITEKAGFISQSVETPRVTSGTACYSSAPRITLIRTFSELEEYFSHYSYQYHFDTISEAISGYDSGWFETHDLLLLAVHSVPTDSACQITSVTEADGIWEIRIAHEPFLPEKPDTTDYHLLLTTEKDQIPSKDAVALFFE